MSYDKLSLDSFKKDLKENKYVNATGARRAVGKASTLTDADKDKARGLIDTHFGEASAPAPKKASAKKAAAKKVAAAPKKTSAEAQPKKAAASGRGRPKKTSAKKASAKAGTKRSSKEGHGSAFPIESVNEHIAQATSLGDIGSLDTQMKIAEKTIQNVGAAISVLTQAKAQYPDADLGRVVEEMGGTLSGAVSIFRQVVNTLVLQSGNDAQKVAAPPPASAPTVPQGIVNNGAPSKAEQLFKESGPEGDAVSPS